jgi:hypothetical protein
MLWLEPGHYVRIEEMNDGPEPRPFKSGFSRNVAYRIMGVFSPSETSEAYMILTNDRDELWFISNRHLRICPVDHSRQALREAVNKRAVKYPAFVSANTPNRLPTDPTVYHAAE